METSKTKTPNKKNQSPKKPTPLLLSTLHKPLINDPTRNLTRIARALENIPLILRHRSRCDVEKTPQSPDDSIGVLPLHRDTPDAAEALGDAQDSGVADAAGGRHDADFGHESRSAVRSGYPEEDGGVC